MVKKIILGILGVIIVLILVVIILIAIFEPKNSKAMDSAINSTVSLISDKYKVNEVSTGEFEKITVYGIMKFHVKQYDVENYGNLCVMKVNMGLMQMSTIVLTPENKNLPLVSTDYMYILGKRTSYVELFDLVENKDDDYMALMNKIKDIRLSYDSLTDVTPSAAWYDELRTESIYKSGTTDDDDAMEKMLLESVEAVLDAESQLPELGDAQKLAKKKLTKQYSDNLIDKGGVSTDTFKKSMGTDKTREFFDKVFFGTEE